jgi:hypothetical protein
LHNCSTTFPNVSKPSARFKWGIFQKI